MITAPEQRGYPRLAVDCGASYRPAGAQDIRTAVIKNISAGGMLFITDDEPELGSTLELRVAPGHLSIPMLSAVVEVVRSVRVENAGAAVNDAPYPGFEVGVRVLSMT